MTAGAVGCAWRRRGSRALLAGVQQPHRTRRAPRVGNSLASSLPPLTLTERFCRDELAGLAKAHPTRFAVHHVLSQVVRACVLQLLLSCFRCAARQPQDAKSAKFVGRLNKDSLAACLGAELLLRLRAPGTDAGVAATGALRQASATAAATATAASGVVGGGAGHAIVATVGAVSSSLDGAAAALPQVLVCGPDAYIAAVQALLAEAGCPKERIWVFL